MNQTEKPDFLIDMSISSKCKFLLGEELDRVEYPIKSIMGIFKFPTVSLSKVVEDENE